VKRIAVFASGNGTNAERLIRYFRDSNDVEISLVLSNNASAGVLKRAEKLGVKSVVFSRQEFVENAEVDRLLQDNKIDFIILAGFLWLIPDFIIKGFPDRIVNIHPALLPKYGGKGMFGMNVHNSVINNGEKQSGISIHYVNSKYDEGQIIFQAKVNIVDKETAETLAAKIHLLEYEHFPIIIEEVLMSL